MFITTFDYISMATLIIMLIVWLILFMLGNKYSAMFSQLDEKEYPLKDLYGMGYAAMEIVHYKYRSKWDKPIRADLVVLYTEKYAEYYLRVIYAQTVTINSVVLICGLVLMLIAADTTMLIITVFMIAVFTYYFMTLPGNTIKKRADELISDYAEVVSNLALLINAGMILREAWEQVAYSGEGVFYKEMQKVVEDLNNGIGESEAFHAFGSRCVIAEAKKFSSTIAQGIQKGNSELAKALQQQSAEVWEQKKQIVKRKGEKAANSLMIPVFLMFGGILIMVIVPIFANLF